MTNHTPAPWVVDGYGDILSERRGEISVVATVCNDEIEITKADRDIILAAPDMYEALKAVFDDGVAFLCSGERVRWLVINALKKARGEV